MGITSGNDEGSNRCAPRSPPRAERPGQGAVQVYAPAAAIPELSQTLKALDLEIRNVLGGLRCALHERAAAVELLGADIDSIRIIPLACCGSFDRLIVTALRGSTGLAPLCLPGLTAPRAPTIPRFGV